MPPIPIHKDAPIKPDGITPQTTDTDDTNQPPPTRTIPASNPAITTARANGPAPPQPGARPIPPTAAYSPTSTSTDPAPPQPGYTAIHTTTETQLGGPPPQYTIPPPSDNYLAGRSTSTSITASKAGPTTLNLGPAQPVASPYQADTGTSDEQRRSLEHPPGYQQAPDHVQGSSMGMGGGGEGGVSETAWGILNKAGEALKKGEEAAWKAVNDKRW